jgi:hypothetical protein
MPFRCKQAFPREEKCLLDHLTPFGTSPQSVLQSFTYTHVHLHSHIQIHTGTRAHTHVRPLPHLHACFIRIGKIVFLIGSLATSSQVVSRSPKRSPVFHRLLTVPGLSENLAKGGDNSI